MNRQLTPTEMHLTRWLLEHGAPDARALLPQLEKAEVTATRCPCGCASFDFAIRGFPEPSGGMHLVADFVFGTDDNLNGIFAFERGGILAGVEVYGLTGDAPKSLPSPESLRPFPAR